MGQQDIAKILRDNYPKYMSYQEILENTNISKQTLFRCLKQLRKREEIIVKIMPGDKLRSRWQMRYKIK